MSTSTESNEMVPADAEKQPIKMDVKIERPHACLRQVIVTIPQSEVVRYTKDAFDDLVPDAQVPGFRAGRAPRKLVEKQFRDRTRDRVKGALLMDSLSQITERQDFSAISEPEFDYESIELPNEGDFIYQFSIEVRPEFATPQWRGLELTKQVQSIEDSDVQDAINRILARYATLEATDEPAEIGDKLLVTAEFSNEGQVLSTMDEERVTLAASLTFPDGVCADFGKLMKGTCEGESKVGAVKLSDSVADEALRGKELQAKFTVVEVMKKEIPALTPALLDELGDFESEEELRSFVRDSLNRQAEFHTHKEVRKRVVELLANSATAFDLPPALVKRQTVRELERKVLELRRNNFDEDQIRRYVNAIRQNAQESTQAALREHFILEQIAEEEKIDADEKDYDAEISLIAQQSDMPERKIRARLEKSGQMDALRNQIVERKVIERIIAAANMKEVKAPKQKTNDDDQEFAVDFAILRTKDDSAIPEAKYDDNVIPGMEEPNEKAKDSE
jgi:trigger factor